MLLARTFRRAPDRLAWHLLPRVAQVYVSIVIVAGAAGLVLTFRRTYPEPLVSDNGSVTFQAAVSADERFDTVGVVRRGSDDAAASRVAGCHCCGSGRRLDAVHVQGQADLSPLSDRLQHGGRSADDGRHGVRVCGAWRIHGS